MKNNFYIKGFTLLEISIALVIIGLIGGGIVVGSSMIRSAEVRSTVVQVDEIRASFNIFKTKYFYYPGDMVNATMFWGAAHADPVTCFTTLGSGTETCNGNGDGEVSRNDEAFRAWQQLANAEIIPGTYKGLSAGWQCLGGDIVPEGRITGTGFCLVNGIHYDPFDIWWDDFFDVEYGQNQLVLGVSPTTGQWSDLPMLRPAEMWSLDSKIDDGRPGGGDILSRTNSSDLMPNCATTDDKTTAEYSMDNDDVVCSLIILFLK